MEGVSTGISTIPIVYHTLVLTLIFLSFSSKISNTIVYVGYNPLWISYLKNHGINKRLTNAVECFTLTSVDVENVHGEVGEIW